jgi:hypothetical protein
LRLDGSDEEPPRDNWTRWVGKQRPPKRRWKSNSYPGAEADPAGTTEIRTSAGADDAET